MSAPPVEFGELVAAAKSRIQEVDVNTVHSRMQASTAMHVIDVREDREWAQGHVAGASHIGRGVLDRDIARQVPDTASLVVVYCGGGGRSALAAAVLEDMGYTNVESMAGGFSAWEGAGLPTAND